MKHFTRIFALPLAIVIIHAQAGRSQEEPLQLQGLLPAGSRTTLTEGWGTLKFEVINRNPSSRDARVAVVYPDQPSVRYARDLWVPARSAITSWLTVGPPPGTVTKEGLEIHGFLYDRTGGQQTLVLPPGEEKIRSRLARYRPRQPSTAMLVDTPIDPENPASIAPRDAASLEAIDFVHVLRAAAGLPDNLIMMQDEFLPQTPEVFDGIDQVILAGSRLLNDPAGLKALRQWVQQGGRLWVMLDRTDSRIVDALLGDDAPFEIIDRVGLTSIRFHTPTDSFSKRPERDHEVPIDQVRIIPSGNDQILIGANGWPAAFARSVGRGRVLFTTVAARAWMRPRDPRDPSRYSRLPNLPAGDRAMDELVIEFNPREQGHVFQSEELRPMLVEEIGYSVMSQPTVIAVLGGFLLALLGIGVGVRRTKRPELVGWLGPIAALGVATLFVVWAESSRRAVQPTTAVVAVADTVPGSDEAAVNGLFAVYQPTSGSAMIASQSGAVLKLDTEGLEGQSRMRLQTDAWNWRYDELALPAGVRTGFFKYSVRTGPISASAHFGSEGVIGKLSTPAFAAWSDAILCTRNRGFLSVQMNDDGSFTSRPYDALAEEQFIAGAVLTDRQQRRQAVYRQLLASATPRHLEDKDLLLTWCEPKEPPFVGPDGGRTISTMLLIVPLEFESTAPGNRVTIPAAFIPFRRVEAGAGKATMESVYPSDMKLRFQLPPSASRIRLERAIVHLRIRAPSRTVQLAAISNDQAIEVYSADSPAEPVDIELVGDRLPQLDATGGIHLRLTIKNLGSDTLETPWRIETLGVDVMGMSAVKE